MSDIVEANKEFYEDRWERSWKQRLLYEANSKRKIAAYALRKAGYRDGGKSVVDVGFGFGDILFSLAKTDSITGVELAESAVAQATREAQRRRFRRARFLTYAGAGPLPLDDAQYDLVICSHVLEHVPDDDALLTEIRRIMKPDGMAFLNIPINEEHVADPLHVRTYTRGGFPAKLHRHGFALRYAYEADRLWSTFGWFIEKEYHKKIPVLGFAIGAFFNISASAVPFGLQRGVEAVLLRRVRPRQFAACVTKDTALPAD